jgi:hypothetical protein
MLQLSIRAFQYGDMMCSVYASLLGRVRAEASGTRTVQGEHSDMCKTFFSLFDVLSSASFRNCQALEEGDGQVILQRFT